jgi:hypothetical protein
MKTTSKIIFITVMILTIGGIVTMSINDKSLPEFLMGLSCLCGTIGFWKNPHLLSKKVGHLPQEIQGKFDWGSRYYFRFAVLFSLASIAAHSYLR